MKKYVMNLSEIMKEKGVSTCELSEMTGIKVTAINEYRGSRKKEPSLYRGLLIARALGVDPWKLIKIENENE